MHDQQRATIGLRMPTVSVTIVSYNQGQYLRQALDSALGQTFEACEIVVSDDASTDDSSGILREYAERHPGRIVPILATKNGGLAENRHRAIQACRGEFVAWLDADDFWSPQKLERQVALMRSDPLCVLSYHNMQVLKGEERMPDVRVRPPMPFKDDSYRTLLEMENYITSSSVMFRASATKRLGYHFEEGPTFSDYHFFVRLARLGALRYLDETLGCYRRHEASATSTKRRNVNSGVRQRREKALKSMLREMPEERVLVRYALARFYISQLRGAMRGGDIRAGLKAALELIALTPQSLQAFADRRANRRVLTGFRY
jgi:glycosyltransferase involved in cell wall biosynthesis